MQHPRKPRPGLVVDAMVRAKQAPRIDAHDTGSLRSDLLSTFRSSAHQKARTS